LEGQALKLLDVVFLELIQLIFLLVVFKQEGHLQNCLQDFLQLGVLAFGFWLGEVLGGNLLAWLGLA